jgi:arylsulfatase A-like enzyme
MTVDAPMRRAGAALLLVGLTGLGACRAAAPRPPRLVLLYATCTLNRDHVAPYGKDVPYTPNLAAFARESIVFQRHQTETDQSGPAYASLFSGTQVDRHGVFRHPALLPDSLYLAAEAFAAQGYDTHFWSGHPMASADLNYGQGVRPANVHRRRPGVADLYALTANDSDFAGILDHLRRDPSYRAFVQVAFTITHSPYTPVDPRAVADFRREYPQQWPGLRDEEVARWARVYDAHYLRLQWDYPKMVRELGLGEADRARLAQVAEAYYDVSVRLLDHCFGRLVDSIRAAGLLEESLIAFTADHGETLYRDDTLFKWTHGAEITPDAIQVPLLLHLPGPGPRTGPYEGVSRSIDVYPTLAGLSGIRVGSQNGVDGVDLSPAVLGREPPPALRAFSHTTLLNPALVGQFRGWLVSEIHPSTDPEHMWVAVRDGDLYARLRKLDGGRWGVDLHDLRPGAAQATVPFDPAKRLHRDLARELDAYKARLLAAYRTHGQDSSPQEAEVLERLRALGYIQ